MNNRDLAIVAGVGLGTVVVTGGIYWLVKANSAVTCDAVVEKLQSMTATQRGRVLTRINAMRRELSLPTYANEAALLDSFRQPRDAEVCGPVLSEIELYAELPS